MAVSRSGSGDGNRHKETCIATLAYRLWQENGCVEGRALDYWLEAERRLREAERPEN